MIDATTYVKIILKKRNMSQMDLVRAMENKGIKGIHKQHLSEALNGRITPLMARKIEIGLELPKYSIVKIVGFPKTMAGMKEIEKIGEEIKGL